MLKGQIDIDLEFTAGTIIFVILVTILFFMILGPLVGVEYSLMASMDEIKATEFANLAKARILDKFGNGMGDLEYDNLDVMVAFNPSELGLGNNYIWIEDLTSGKSWKMGGERGKIRRDIFATISSSFLPVTDESTAVMEAGKEYLIQVYNVGREEKNMMFDIYEDYICSSESENPTSSLYKSLDCGEISGLVKTNADLNYIKSDILTPVRNKAKTSSLARIVPLNDVIAGRLPVSGMRFGDLEKCTENERNYLCFRVMGDNVLPAKIHIEIEKGRELVTPVKSGS